MYLEVLDTIKQELASTRGIDIPNIIPALYNAERVFVAGAGRSKLVASMFAMRLMHCGCIVHIIGDVTTPSLNSADAFFVVSSSGETTQLISFAKKAKSIGAKVVVVTSNKNSTLGTLSDIAVQIGNPDIKMDNPLPLGSKFELSTLVYLESLIIQIMKNNDLTDEHLQYLHANVE